jgi:hypothetical protein
MAVAQYASPMKCADRGRARPRARLDSRLRSALRPGVPLLTTPHHAVWLLPTPEFRSAAFAGRGSSWAIAGETNDPEKALGNLPERDRMFTDWLDEETNRLELRALESGEIADGELVALTESHGGNSAPGWRE